MKYSIKVVVYKEGLPFDKWFQYKSCKKERVIDLMNSLGLDEDRIGIILVNDYKATKTRLLEDEDRIRFVGKIYPGYL